jgi:hypothetical protein
MSGRIMAPLAVLAAALTLGGGAGAGTASQPPKKIDLTNPAAVDSYLTSIGVNPATVVRQVGLNNYAGPNCPGIGWNCTTSTKAVQVSSAGGQNKFDCTGEDPANVLTDETTNTCVILQGGPGDNKAQCKMKDVGEPVESQRCIIDQTGTRNLAIVDQLIEQRKGPDQDARQLADVRQREGAQNQSQIHQDVKQDTTTGDKQNQHVHQVALVYQQATGSENFSHVHQNQDLSESGAADVQNQNVAPLSGSPPLDPVDCDPEHKNSSPNECANVIQTTTSPAGGKNASHLHQNINERAKTTASPSTQQQEDELTGIEAHIDQTNPPGMGTNMKVVHQDGRQRAEGGTSQTQIMDPRCCGVGTTVGGASDTDDFHQTAIQSASLGTAAFQKLDLTGDTSHVAEAAPPDFLAVAAGDGTNVCRITHDARNNVDSTKFTVKIDPCDFPVSLTTRCFSASAADSETGYCTDPTETESITTFPSSATFGQPIDPPNFGEPSDFPGPIFPGI